MIHSDLTEKKLMEVRRALDMDAMVIVMPSLLSRNQMILQVFLISFFYLKHSDLVRMWI